jgi:hypothetical protein
MREAAAYELAQGIEIASQNIMFAVMSLGFAWVLVTIIKRYKK